MWSRARAMSILAASVAVVSGLEYVGHGVGSLYSIQKHRWRKSLEKSRQRFELVPADEQETYVRIKELARNSATKEDVKVILERLDALERKMDAPGGGRPWWRRWW